MNQKNIVKDIQSKLFDLQDIKYRDFHAKLMPTVNKEDYRRSDSCTAFICKGVW